MPFDYHYGFGNEFISERAEGAVPLGQNTPQKCSYNAYAEQLSGTAFTAPRKENQRTWLYRANPSAIKNEFYPYSPKGIIVSDFNNTDNVHVTPAPLRWDPFTLEINEPIDFIDGINTICGSGSSSSREGLAIHVYTFNKSMEKKAFYNSDGDFLFVPQQGSINIQTEFGWLEVEPLEIAVIPRGIKYRICVKDGQLTRGYLLEVYGKHFELPELGPIGANGLANKFDFMYPKANYDEQLDLEYEIVTKFQGLMFSVKSPNSPFDVIGWKGNYLPYKYDLRKYMAINTVSYDHPDPSIFTVLTSKSDQEGTAIADFVIFPPRWAVAENTFRPPYFHRNNMSEFMGLIKGQYEGKQHGFMPGGASLHNIMTPHGPDAKTFELASQAELAPQKVGEGTMSFMFESSLFLRTTEWAMSKCGKLQSEYFKVWEPLKQQLNTMNLK